MKKVFAPSLVLAGLLVAGNAAADGIYDSWLKNSDVDVSKSVDISKSTDIRKSEDNDYTSIYKSSEDNDVSEDNDYTSIYKSSEDNDVSEDNDFAFSFKKSEDNDYTSHYTHQEDNDVDSQLAKSSVSSLKYQDQDAGHQADTSVFGTASGHRTQVTGGPTIVSAGNDEQRFYGPAMVNTNTNQMPVNTAYVLGSNLGSPINQANTFAGRDMGPKGVFAPVGNTSATVLGDVSQASGAQVGQSGDAANSIADPISTSITK